jgi:ParB-like nuclease domain
MFSSLTHSTGVPALDAHSDFARARRAHLAARARRRLTGRRGPGAPATPPAGPHHGPLVPRIAVVPLAAIVGTAEPSPHFDERFRPASAQLRPRWERVAHAVRRGAALPPITVRKRPEGYYVVDGRHRVSVARATGQRDIDAWVT